MRSYCDPSGVRADEGHGFDIEAFVDNRDFANLLAHRSILIGLARGATNELLQAIDELSKRLGEAV